MFNKLKRFFWWLSSLEAGLILLSFLFVIVLVGTFAQIEHGIFSVQKIFFQSWFLWLELGTVNIPVFPGGGLVGTVLVISLTLSTALRLKWNRHNIGLVIVHLSLILLLIGAGMTSLLSNESQLYLAEGESKFYSEHLYDCDLIIMDASNPQYNYATAIPTARLGKTTNITHPSLPFAIDVHLFYENAQVSQPRDPNFINPGIKEGVGTKLRLNEIPVYTSDDKKNNPSAIVSFKSDDKLIGPFLVSLDINGAQKFSVQNKEYYVFIQPKRFYFPFTVHLKEFTEDYYPGSTIPRDYSSLVDIIDFEPLQEREALIYMNHPLRHKGFTFYQASFGEEEPSSVFQVVENPTWLIPYLSSCLIAIGMLIHFISQFLRFRKKKQ